VLGILSKPKSSVEARPASAAEALSLLYWADGKRVRMWLPTALCCMQGCFRYAGGWHPFVEALRSGPQALAHFYRGFQPATLAEMYALPSSGLRGEDLQPWELPWLMRASRTAPPGELGLDSAHGVSFYGPASGDKIQLEFERLRSVRASIQQHGYRPEQYGDITGQFLRSGGEYRFFVRGGKHRAAALAALGYERLPVTFKAGWPRAVSLETSAEWPLVREGSVDESLARAAFLRYFQFDGSQQASALPADPPTAGEEMRKSEPGSSALLARYQGKNAAEYEDRRKLNRRFRAEQRLFTEMLAGLQISSALDCPVGTLRWAEDYKRMGVQVFGIDLSGDMLQIAQRRATETGLERVQLIQADIFDARLSQLVGGQADIVICVRFLNWVPFERAMQVIGHLATLTREYLLLGVSLRPNDWPLVRRMASRASLLIDNLARRRRGDAARYVHSQAAFERGLQAARLKVLRRESVFRKASLRNYFYLVAKEGHGVH
jgi:ubiquinone/menaquinone biosynthesis C-methylase UbiE